MPEPSEAPPLHEKPQHTRCDSYRDDYAGNRVIDGGNTDDNGRENNAAQYGGANHSPLCRLVVPRSQSSVDISRDIASQADRLAGQCFGSRPAYM